jgi:hypothetical protein
MNIKNELVKVLIVLYELFIIMDCEFDKLNDDWIHNFEKTDKLYQDFYKDRLYYTNVNFFYVNRNNDIEKIKQESFLMSEPNFISREEIIGLLKKNSIENGKRYTLLSILKYNITLDVDDITEFLTSHDVSCYNEKFLTHINHIDSITFGNSINMFHDLNDLILIFYEKSTELKTFNSLNATKKIYLKSNTNKKTIRKQYKE